MLFLCMYSIYMYGIVGNSSAKGTKDGQLAILSSFSLLIFFSYRLCIDFTFVDTKKMSTKSEEEARRGAPKKKGIKGFTLQRPCVRTIASAWLESVMVNVVARSRVKTSRSLLVVPHRWATQSGCCCGCRRSSQRETETRTTRTRV